MSRGAMLAVVVVVALLSSGSPGAPFHPSAAAAIPGPSPPLISDARAVPAAAATSAVPSSEEVRLTLTLGFSNSTRLEALLTNLEDPHSAQYRAFLSAYGFDHDFAPTDGEVSAVESELREFGARNITPSPARVGVSALLTPAEVDQFLGVTLVTIDGQSGYAAVGTPVLPQAIRGLVVGIGGLSDLVSPAPAAFEIASSEWPVNLPSGAQQFVQSNSSTADWFVGSDYAQAYHATSLWPVNATVPDATFPTGMAIATLLASGYDSTTGKNLPPWDPAVISAYFNDTLPATWPIPVVTGVPVTLPGGTAPPAPGSFAGVNDSSLDETENSLDLEMAGSLAPGAALYNFYFPGSAIYGPSPLGDQADDFAADLGAALNYNYTHLHQNLSVVSASFGLPEINDTLWDSYLEEAAATGVTVVAASGDQADAPNILSGRDQGQWPLWPSTAAFNTSGAVSVGGVSVSLDGTATSVFNGSVLNATFDPTVHGIANQSVWFDRTRGPGAYVGSEGGASMVYPEPWWQFHSAAQPAIVNATIEEGASSLGRAVPDLALPANSTIIYDYANKTGTVYAGILEGTSVAAPVLAGLLTDVVAVESAQKGSFAGLGFIDPELYRIASYYAAYLGPTDPLSDVVNGSNFVFSALPGWDAASGWGGLNVTLLLAADQNATVRNYTYTGPTPGLPPRSSSPWSPLLEYAVIGAVVVAAVILVVVLARRSSRPARTPPPMAQPPGVGTVPYVQPPPLGPPSDFGSAPLGPPPPELAGPATTMVCPFCGAARPTEPAPCPRCGAR